MSALHAVGLNPQVDTDPFGDAVSHDTLAGVALPVPPLRPSSSAVTVLEAFAADDSLYAIAVVDDREVPVGLINRFKFLETLTQPNGRDLLKNRPAAMIMDRAPLILDEHTPIDRASEILSDNTTKYIFDGFIVTRKSRYVGLGTGYSLMRRLTERRQVSLAHLAYHDTLTGLPNRQLFLDRLSQALASAARNHRRIAVLSLDLDRFKTVNDELGHSIGDLLLQQTAERFRSLIRAQDTVARLGGDEFAFVLTEVAAIEHAEMVAEKLLAMVRQPYALDGHEVRTSCSIGLVAFPDHAENQTTLLRMVDDALYSAKRTRNAVQRYSTEMARPTSSGPLLFNTIRRAIELKQLEVHYQPIAELHTGALYGLEALVRWLAPGSGFIPTNELIQIAEESGLISEITDFVCGRSMRQVRSWHDAGLIQGVRLSINVAGSEVRDGVLLPMLKGHVRSAGLTMSMIDIELTESGLMHSDRDATQLLSELRQAGVRILVDDFGTGYSSLGRLQRLPVDVLKIDRAFIEDVGTDPRQGALVQAIVMMAHSLELTVVAEGVETDVQREFLKAHGCDLYQGYLLSRPLAADDMQRFLEAHQ